MSRVRLLEEERMPTVALAQGSLTAGEELVLVNASNTNAALGSGVSGAIRKACGPGYQEAIEAALQRRFGGPMRPGQVLLTDAGAHPRARYVAHVAVMDYRRGMSASSFPTLEVIRAGCEELWRVLEAETQGPLSVAMVALGAGTGGLGVRGPTQVACETLQVHWERQAASRVERVVFYGYALPEHLVICEVVTACFPEAASSLPAEVQEVLRARRAE